MRKFFTGIALTLALTMLPAMAADQDRLEWIDSMDGVKVTSTKIKPDEVEKEYAFKSQKTYEGIVNGFKKRGWEVSYTKINRDCPNMPDVYMMKGNQTVKIDIDKKMGFEGPYYEAEIEIEYRDFD